MVRGESYRGPHFNAPRNNNLRGVMKRHGLSAGALADRIPCTHRAVGQWAQGINKVPDYAYERIRLIDTTSWVEHAGADVLVAEECQGFKGPGLPTPLEVVDHLAGCGACMARAFQAVVAPILLLQATRPAAE